MKYTLRTFAVLALFSALAAGAQSLGDLARQTREQAAQSASAQVYTNANLPQAGNLSVIGATATPPAAATDETATALPAESPELEQQWRKRFADARQALDLAQRKLDVTQRELNLAQVQYYSNPNVELQQETTRGNLDTLRAEVSSLQTEVAQRQAALDALSDELSHAGLPAAWGRP